MRKFAMIFIAAAMMLPAANLSARSWYDDDDEDRYVPLTYAYPTTIEFSLGYSGAPYSVTGDAGSASGVMNGVSSFLRVSTFFTKHFGGFFQAGLSGCESSDVNYFGTVNKADGNKYRYSGSTPDCEHFPILLAGPVLRFDFGKLSLRPRAGLGVAWFSTYDNSYQRIARDGDFRTSPATYYHVYYSLPTFDFLDGSDSNPDSYFVPTFVVAPSLQLTYTLRTHCFLSLEAGYNFTTKKMTRTVYRAESVDAYNPENFVEELYFSDRIGTYMEGDGVVQNEMTGTVADLFYVNFGIGWNIGHNRNQKGRYYHKY